MQTEQFKKLIHPNHELPLCVDLDGTLIRTDSLFELAFRFIKQKPLLIFLIPIWLLKSKSFLKSELSKRVDINAASLPYNQDVFYYLKRMSKRGRPMMLVTGADQAIAEKVASHLGVFSEVYGSNSDVNLIGERKAELLVHRFGEKGFDYVGDSKHDLHVWKHAHAAIVVSSKASLAGKAAKLTQVEKVFPTVESNLVSIIKALRPHQWIKNILIFFPLFLAHQFTNPSVLFDSFIGFVSFSAMASLIYVINDLSDLENDRQHPDKKHRPFASGNLHLGYAALLIPLLLTVSVYSASYLTAEFNSVLIAYFLTTTTYTFSLKKVPIADIMLLSSLYTLRLLAGSAITYIIISEWLMAFSGFLFFSLATLKRFSELRMLLESGKVKSAGRGYDVNDISAMINLGICSSFGAIVVLALYINSDGAKQNYANASILWLICPLLLFSLARIWFLANRGKIGSDPVKFAVTDIVNLAIFSVSALVWIFASGGYFQ